MWSHKASCYWSQAWWACWQRDSYGRPMPLSCAPWYWAPMVALHPTSAHVMAQNHTPLSPSGCLCEARLSSPRDYPLKPESQRLVPVHNSSPAHLWFPTSESKVTGSHQCLSLWASYSTCTLCVSRFSPHQVTTCPWRLLTWQWGFPEQGNLSSFTDLFHRHRSYHDTFLGGGRNPQSIIWLFLAV